MIRVHRLTLILKHTVGELVSQTDLSARHNHPAPNKRLQIKYKYFQIPKACLNRLFAANTSSASTDSINRALSPPLCAPTLLLSSAFVIIIFFFFTFSLFICLLHPRIHIETIRFRSNSLLEKTSGRYGAVRRAVNLNYQRFSERRLRAQNQTFSPHPGVCLRIHGGRADGSGQSAAVNYRHCCCLLVTSKSKQSVERDYSVRKCTCCHMEPPRARRKHPGFGRASGRVEFLVVADQNKTPKSVGLNYWARKTRQEINFVDVEMTLSFLPAAMTQRC